MTGSGPAGRGSGTTTSPLATAGVPSRAGRGVQDPPAPGPPPEGHATNGSWRRSASGLRGHGRRRVVERVGMPDPAGEPAHDERDDAHQGHDDQAQRPPDPCPHRRSAPPVDGARPAPPRRPYRTGRGRSRAAPALASGRGPARSRPRPPPARDPPRSPSRIRAFEGAKSRLGAVLDAEERRDLVERLLRRTVAAALATRRRDRGRRGLARRRGARRRRGRRRAGPLAQRSRGLNPALQEARGAIDADRLLVLPGRPARRDRPPRSPRSSRPATRPAPRASCSRPTATAAGPTRCCSTRPTSSTRRSAATAGPATPGSRRRPTPRSSRSPDVPRARRRHARRPAAGRGRGRPGARRGRRCD